VTRTSTGRWAVTVIPVQRSELNTAERRALALAVVVDVLADDVGDIPTLGGREALYRLRTYGMALSASERGALRSYCGLPMLARMRRRPTWGRHLTYYEGPWPGHGRKRKER